MDHEQAGPSRPRQQAIESQERELEVDLDLQALSFLFSSGHYDDEKLSAPAIVNQEVNGLFEDLAQMHGLLITMKASPAADIMGGFASAYEAVDHAIFRVGGILPVLETDVADALKRSLGELRRGILALEGDDYSCLCVLAALRLKPIENHKSTENLESDEDKTFVIDMIAALPELDDGDKATRKGKAKASGREDDEIC